MKKPYESIEDCPENIKAMGYEAAEKWRNTWNQKYTETGNWEEANKAANGSVKIMFEPQAQPELPEYVKNLSPELQKLWLDTFQQVMQETNDGDAAMQAADAAVDNISKSPEANAERKPDQEVDPEQKPIAQKPEGAKPGDEAQKPVAGNPEAKPGDTQRLQSQPDGQEKEEPKAEPNTSPQATQAPPKAADAKNQPANDPQTTPNLAQQKDPGATPPQQQVNPKPVDPNQPPVDPNADPNMAQVPNDDDVVEELRKMLMRVLQRPMVEKQMQEEQGQKMATEPIVEPVMMSELNIFRDAFPGSFEGEKVKVQVFQTGKWVHPTYGKLEIKVDDLENMLKNFDETKRSVVIDYDHGTDVGQTPEDRKAAGWLKELHLEKASNGDAKLWGVADLTEDAAKYVKKGEYRLFSPTWVPEMTDKETGQSRGITLLRGALTNNPFIDGMHPAVPLSDRAAELMSKENNIEAIKSLGAKNGANPETIQELINSIESGRNSWISEPQNATPATTGVKTQVDNSFTFNMPNHSVRGDKNMDGVLGDVKFASERIGLPASMNATPQQFVEQAYLNFAEITKLRQENVRLNEQLAMHLNAAKNLKNMEIDILVKDAIRDGKIDPVDADFIKIMFERDPAATKNYLATKKSRRYLSIEQGLNGNFDSPVSATAEVESKAREFMASEKQVGRDVKFGQAQMLILSQNPDLAARYRSENVQGLGGGDR